MNILPLQYTTPQQNLFVRDIRVEVFNGSKKTLIMGGAGGSISRRCAG